VAAPLGAVLLVELVLVVVARRAAPPSPARPPGFRAGLASLFTDYLLPFELTSVLLLAAMVGVLLLTSRRA
jgi:NADH:ubiquinone oxidoreductase subunit 6 (subunit J)